MGEKERYRIINTVTAAAGALACFISGFILSPAGLLSEERNSIIQVLSSGGKAVMFVLPTLLLIAAAMLVLAGKLRAISLVAALAGACLFALIDISIVTNHRAFEGILLNEAGIVLAVSGSLLHALGTPKEKDKKYESTQITDSRYREEKGPESLDYTDGFYRGADEVAISEMGKRNTEDFGKYLTATLRAITEENDGAPREKGRQERRSEDSNLWMNNSELEELLKEDIRQSEIWSSEVEDKGKIVESTGDADFYASLEDVFRTEQ